MASSEELLARLIEAGFTDQEIATVIRFGTERELYRRAVIRGKDNESGIGIMTHEELISLVDVLPPEASSVSDKVVEWTKKLASRPAPAGCVEDES